MAQGKGRCACEGKGEGKGEGGGEGRGEGEGEGEGEGGVPRRCDVGLTLLVAVELAECVGEHVRGEHLAPHRAGPAQRLAAPLA